jgi:hypothetical protein
MGKSYAVAAAHFIRANMRDNTILADTIKSLLVAPLRGLVISGALIAGRRSAVGSAACWPGKEQFNIVE